ncbi:MAG: hypothetical protein IJ123_04725 [Blautia sp.]|nr:hypothetical protein [Blautia sp.]
MTNCYRFADVNIRITYINEAVNLYCKDYRTDEPADFAVIIEQKDIDYERSRAEHSGFSDAYLETLAVYRKIAERMPQYDACLLHGSAIAVDGAAYIFTAASGTGKSTHARLWRELLGDRAVMINDDKPFIRVHSDGTAAAYGTPWDGKHHLSRNIAAPVRSVCILERSAENHIRQITKEEAFPMLLRQIYRPADPEALSKTLKLIDRLNVKLYRLGCNMESEAAEISYNTMKEE